MPRHPLAELTLARFREFIREPEALFWSFLFPVLMTCALGIAFGSGSQQRLMVGVADTTGSDGVKAALERAGGFTTRDVPMPDIDTTLRDGGVAVVVVPGTPPAYHFDEARAESLAARLAVDSALQRAAGRVDAFSATDRPVTVIGSRYIDWVIPGLLGMGIMSTGMWSVGFSIANARSRKLLKRLVATPMVRGHYLASFVLSRFVFLALEAVVLVAFAWLVFDVAVHGSLMTFALVCGTGALAFGGLALLVASRPRTIEGLSGLLNFVMLPMWVLSGVFLPRVIFRM